LKPYGRILRKRVAERARAAGLNVNDVDVVRLKAVCESCPWLHMEAEEEGDWCVLLVGRLPNFVDVYSPQDRYPESMWAAAASYFSGLTRLRRAEMSLPGGRYSCAQTLASRSLPFLQGRSLGQISHIVQLAISQKKLLGYFNGTVVPYSHSQSKLKERFAERQRPCAKAARGHGPRPLATWDSVRACIREILVSALPETGALCPTVPLSDFKNLFRDRFHLELSETALGHSKLSELLRDHRLADICTVKLQGHAYMVVPQCHVPVALPRQGMAIRLEDELPPPFSCGSGLPDTIDWNVAVPLSMVAPTTADWMQLPVAYNNCPDQFVIFPSTHGDANPSPPSFADFAPVRDDAKHGVIRFSGPNVWEQVCDAIFAGSRGDVDRMNDTSSAANVAAAIVVDDLDNLDWDTAFPETACRRSASADMFPSSLSTPVPTTPAWLYCSTPSWLSPCPAPPSAVIRTPTPHQSSPAAEVACCSSIGMTAPLPLSPRATTPALLFCATPSVSSMPTTPSTGTPEHMPLPSQICLSVSDEESAGQRQWLEPMHSWRGLCSDEPLSPDRLAVRHKLGCELLVKNGFYHVPTSSASGAASRTLSLPKEIGTDTRSISQEHFAVLQSRLPSHSCEVMGGDPHVPSSCEKQDLRPPRKELGSDESRTKASAPIRGQRRYPQMPPRWKEDDDDDVSAGTKESAIKGRPPPSPSRIASPCLSCDGSTVSSPCSLELAQNSKHVMRLAELVC